MPCIDDIDERLRRELLYCAVVEHYRTWLFFDGSAMQKLRNNAQKFDVQLVKLIIDEYGLKRPLGGCERQSLVDFLNERLGELRADFRQRIENCATIAEDICTEHVAQKRQPVAISKFMWFMAPKNWTMFDSHASEALGVANGDCVKRVQVFYRKLEQRGFAGQANAVSKTLHKNGFSALYGERVIDKFLWLVGAAAEKREATQANCDLFQNSLSDASRDELSIAAQAVTDVHAESLLRVP